MATITATEFELKDSLGNSRATFSIDGQNRVNVQLFNAATKKFASISESFDGDEVRKRSGSGTGPILLSQATFLLAHIANNGSVPLSRSAFPLWEARRRAGAIKATQATNLMVFPAVSDHSRLLVRLAFIGRPRWGLRSRELVVRSLRHLPWGSRRQAMKFRRSAAGKSRCRTPLPSRGAELLPEWRAF